jgi:hypothetical protein
VQEFHQVELVDQGVGQFDEGLGQSLIIHQVHLRRNGQ